MTKQFLGFKLSGLLVLVFAVSALGQIDSTGQKVDSATAETINEEVSYARISIYYPKYQVAVAAKFGAASKEFSSNQLLEIGTGNFLTENVKNELIDAASTKLRLGYHQHLEIGYCTNGLA